MGVSRTSTFEQTPPHRPAAGDILNGTKTNATSTVPANLPSAEEFEQIAALVEACARMAPAIRLSIVFSAGAPVIQQFAAVRRDAVSGDFTLAHAGAGDVEISWSSSKYAAANTAPIVSLNVGGTANHRTPDAVMTAPSSGVTGVRIRTKDATGTPVDVPFTVEVF